MQKYGNELQPPEVLPEKTPKLENTLVLLRRSHRPPVAKMSPQEVLLELGQDRNTHPLEALESADAHRAALRAPGALGQR